MAAASLGLLRFCRGQSDLVDAFLRDVLQSFTQRAAQTQAEVAVRLRELERIERRRLDDEGKNADQRGRRRGGKLTQLDERTINRLRREAHDELANRPSSEDAAIVAAWSERTRAWTALSEVFGDLGEMMGRGWDMSIGVLKHTGWADLMRLRELVEQLPQLREVIRSLGRLQVTETEEAVAETIFLPIRRLEEERREAWTPHMPTEMRGIERSGEIARMLPVEAVNLGHPKLRVLWHARRAERALLTYRVEGIAIERTLVERESSETQELRRPRPQRGPILAVLDTSGSMHGLPETVAKTLVLETLRTAHQEKRRCFLFAYSGPGQVLEQELDLSPEGVGRLLAFLGQSFGGGNDEIGVITRVTQRLEEKDWKRADVVFVSDGEWPAPPHLVRLVGIAKEAGTRFHGVQIGNRGRTGLHAICDPVHVFQNWAAACGW